MKKLIEQAKSGNRTALRELLMTHQQLIQSVVRRYALDKTEHDDVLQNICKKVIFSIGTYTETARFSTWLYRLAMNECMDANRAYYRRRCKYETRGMKTDLFPDVNAPDGLSDTLSAEVQDTLREVIVNLPEGMRSAIDFFYKDELSGSEAAEKLGISSQTFFVRLSAAREKIRQELFKKGVYHEKQ